MTTQLLTCTAPLLRRDDLDPAAEADPAADAATGYDISGVAVPFNEEYASWAFTEMFDRACEFEGLESAKLYWQHRDAIGKVTGSESTDTGLMIDAQISRTPRGDEAATLVRDGVIDSLSIGFEGIEYRVEARDDADDLRVWTRIRIREVSLVSFPAYDSATLTEVRNRPNQKGVPTMPTIEPVTTADLDNLRSEQSEQLRSMQAQLATIGEQRQALPPRFATFGHFVRAYHAGDAEARSLHADWHAAAADASLHNQRAYDGTVLADTIARDPWVGDSIRLIDKGRRVLNSFLTAPLPATGSRIEHGVLESNTVKVEKQAAEGDALAKGKVVVGSDTAPVGTYGGWSELSFQSVERADVSVLNLTRRAQLIAYAQQTEAEVRALFAATSAANIVAGHNLDLIAAAKAADWVSLMIDAHDAFDDAALPIAGLYLSKDKFKELFTLADASDRLQFQIVAGTGSNVVGELSLPGTEGPEGTVASTRVRLLPGSAPGRGAFYNEQAITTWENAGAPVALEDMNVTNLTRAYSVYGYLACAAEMPDAILPIEFAV